MLHIGILPNHVAWAPFLRNLRLIVLDELHSLQGVFGSHVALVLRRLLRLAHHYRSDPTLIATSATVGNPVQLFTALTGREPIHISRDGAPKGERTLWVVNPPANPKTGERISQNYVSGLILARCVEEGIRTLAFSQSRLAAELVLAYARQTLVESGLDSAVDSYRAGYTPDERRHIERRLFGGDLLGLSCTSAMELGVDVGDVEAVILNGYPGSTNSLVQRAGRAGRGGKDSVTVLILGDSPLDQYFARHPQELVSAEPESVSIKPNNEMILKYHLLCAAWERPLNDKDSLFFPDGADSAIAALVKEGELRPRSTGIYPAALDSPAAAVSLRSIGAQYQVIHEGTTIATIEEWRALEAAYEGAIYLHRGDPYEVTRMNTVDHTIHVAPFDGDYYTRANVSSTVETLVIEQERPAPPIQATLERIRVTRQTVGYEKRRLVGDVVLGRYDLDLPPRIWETQAVHLILDESLNREFQEAEWILAVHALEHILLTFSASIAECNRGDLGSAWRVGGDGHIYVYDSIPGGIGLAEVLYEKMEHWIAVSLEALRACPCSGGCPSCILSAQCWGLDEHQAKAPALALADHLIRSASALEDTP
jgi:DEAD/DEAH box helicase domain-containing protein